VAPGTLRVEHVGEVGDPVTVVSISGDEAAFPLTGAF
jgi:hypothetical protein